jgi:hypothetical protein
MALISRFERPNCGRHGKLFAAAKERCVAWTGDARLDMMVLCGQAAAPSSTNAGFDP